MYYSLFNTLKKKIVKNLLPVISNNKKALPT